MKKTREDWGVFLFTGLWIAICTKIKLKNIQLWTLTMNFFVLSHKRMIGQIIRLFEVAFSTPFAI